jgi:hypothetical protein
MRMVKREEVVPVEEQEEGVEVRIEILMLSLSRCWPMLRIFPRTRIPMTMMMTMVRVVSIDRTK